MLDPGFDRIASIADALGPKNLQQSATYKANSTRVKDLMKSFMNGIACTALSNDI